MSKDKRVSPTDRLVEADYAIVEERMAAYYLSAVEFGFKMCEKGHNLEATRRRATDVFTGKVPWRDALK